MSVKVRLMNRSDSDDRRVDTFNYDVSLLGSSVSAAQARADAAYDLAKKGGGGGGGTDLTPVSPIYIQDGKIGCRTASDFSGDNSRPMTASGVKTIVGDIESLLKEI